MLFTLSKPYSDGMVDYLSASIGVASFPDDADDDFHIKLYADKAMYHSKNSGKNRVTFYQSIA